MDCLPEAHMFSLSGRLLKEHTEWQKMEMRTNGSHAWRDYAISPLVPWLGLMEQLENSLCLHGMIMGISYIIPRGLQRDLVYLGWPTAPSYMSPNAGGGGELRGSHPMSMSTAVHRSPNKLWRSTTLFNLWVFLMSKCLNVKTIKWQNINYKVTKV